MICDKGEIAGGELEKDKKGNIKPNARWLVTIMEGDKEQYSIPADKVKVLPMAECLETDKYKKAKKWCEFEKELKKQVGSNYPNTDILLHWLKQKTELK